MRIQSSNILLSSGSYKMEGYYKREALKYWDSNKSIEQSSSMGALTVSDSKDFSVKLSEESLKKLHEEINSTKLSQTSNEDDYEVSTPEELKAKMLEEFIRALTGKKIKLNQIDHKLLEDIKNPGNIPGIKIANGPAQMRNGWGLSYSSTETYVKSEKMSFDASGTIQTADGKKIEFDLNLNVSREFISQNSINIKAGDALCDPLVINYAAASATLGNTKFSFDIDANGTLDQISFLRQGSGFLALDENGDGRINDGKELFGTQSGNGFSDLAAYDMDKNNWIDENDAIYKKLRIWTKDKDGNDQLFALGQKGIGAIYLGNADTKFGLNDSGNVQLGQISRTGVFLRENGSVGTVQHVDLVL